MIGSSMSQNLVIETLCVVLVQVDLEREILRLSALAEIRVRTPH